MYQHRKSNDALGIRANEPLSNNYGNTSASPHDFLIRGFFFFFICVQVLIDVLTAWVRMANSTLYGHTGPSLWFDQDPAKKTRIQVLGQDPAKKTRILIPTLILTPTLALTLTPMPYRLLSHLQPQISLQISPSPIFSLVRS